MMRRPLVCCRNSLVVSGTVALPQLYLSFHRDDFVVPGIERNEFSLVNVVTSPAIVFRGNEPPRRNLSRPPQQCDEVPGVS